ncbi:hypothetical protein CRUP_012678 [Coryphaenoides rupestris]|nr:hypothetical protein CRUP_012678 [Coryphaenoides rupestris]
MPVRRGHVAPQNTFLDTIIRKFEGQNRKFIIANARVENCAIIFCNDAFCAMCGYTRGEVMQKSCTCSFLYGPGTRRPAVAQMAKALLGAEERKVEMSLYSRDVSAYELFEPGNPPHSQKQAILGERPFEVQAVRSLRGISVCEAKTAVLKIARPLMCRDCFQCSIDVVPVKNEDGLVIMFILNFELPTDPKPPSSSSPSRELNHSPELAARLPPLGHESVVLEKLLSLPERQRLQGDEAAGAAAAGLLLWDQQEEEEEEECQEVPDSHREGAWKGGRGEGRGRGDPRGPASAPPTVSGPLVFYRSWTGKGEGDEVGEGSPRASSLENGTSSVKHSSSVDDLKKRRSFCDRRLQMRHSCSECLTTVHQLTQSLLEPKTDSYVALHSGERDILAPCKLMDRTHHVTEKVTQSAVRAEMNCVLREVRRGVEETKEMGEERKTRRFIEVCLLISVILMIYPPTQGDTGVK